MSGTHVTDEELVAFLHGELPPERSVQIEAAINDDAVLAGRAEALDRQDQLVRQAFAPLLDAPIPAALSQILSEADDATTGNVVSLAETRNAKLSRATQNWRWPQFTAMAASLALGMVVGPTLFGGGTSSGSLLVATADGLKMSEELMAVLDDAAGGERVALGNLSQVQVDLSFRNLDRDLCRQAQVSQGGTTHDLLACRTSAGWQIEALGRREESAGEFRTAGGDAAPAVVTTVDAMIAGDPLVGEAERDALNR